MRKEFVGYYPPTQDEYKKLWSEGLVVLDTNVLLDLYRMPGSARDEFLDAIGSLSARLWIPHQVALEFQLNRLGVIANERKITESALSEANKLFEEAQLRISSLQIDKRGLGIDPNALIDELDKSKKQIIEAINKVHADQLDVSIQDPVRTRLDSLLDGKIGDRPKDQPALDALCQDGEERYSNKIPPGFEDVGKDKNPNDATYFYDGIKYQRKFGDLIFWRQLLNHVRGVGVKFVLLITSERKEDWWWKEKGRTIGPRPELAREANSQAGVEILWMYSSSQFLENARSFIQAKVSEQSVSQIEEIERLATIHDKDAQAALPNDRPSMQERFSPPEFSKIGDAILHWLEESFGEARQIHEFPDFIVDLRSGPHGYDFKYIRNFSRMIVSPGVVNSMLRGYMEINERRLIGFSLIIVAEEADMVEIYTRGRDGELKERMEKLLQKYPIDEIIIGILDRTENFVEVSRIRGFRRRSTLDWGPKEA